MRSTSRTSGKALVAAAIALAVIGWSRVASRADAVEQVAPAPVPEPRPAPQTVPEPPADDDDGDDAPPPAAQKLDPNSQAFISRVDDEIPRRLYATALSCGTGVGTHRDQKVKLGVQIEARGGEVSVREATVLESTISDPSLVECMRLAVRTARWRDDEMPDWADDDEIVVRLRGANKYTPDD